MARGGALTRLLHFASVVHSVWMAENVFCPVYFAVSLAEDHDVTVPRGTSVNRKDLLPISWKMSPITIANERPMWSTAMRQSLIMVNFDVVYDRPRAV